MKRSPGRFLPAATALLAAAIGTACKRAEDLGRMKVDAPAAGAAAAASDLAFDAAWKALSKQDIFYIEDDRGDGLMGRVWRGTPDDPFAPPAQAEARDGTFGSPQQGSAAVAAAKAPGKKPADHAAQVAAGKAAAAGIAIPALLTGDDVSAVVRRQMGNVKYCYLSVSRKSRSVSGRAIVSFTVGKDGTVGDVRVEAPAFRETDLARCVTQQVSRWEFPKSRQGGVTVSYPLVFVGG